MNRIKTRLSFKSFQQKIEKKFIPLVKKPMADSVSAFVDAGLPVNKIDTMINFVPELAPVLNNMYYQCGYGWGYATYKEYKNVKQDKKVTPEDIALAVSNELRLSLANNVHGIERSVKDAIIAMIEQGAVNGWGYEKTAQKVNDIIDVNRALRIVRTESVKAANYAGITGAQATGLLMDKQWLTARDFRVRGNPAGKYPNAEFDHWDMQGQTVPIDKPFFVGGEELQYPGDPDGSPGDIINCFPEDTLIEGQFVGGQRLKYSGEMIEIITASGKRLSVTPNHPVFTSEGLIKARLLTNGKYVISNIKEIDASSSLWNNHVYKKPITAAEVFTALYNLGSPKQVMIMGLDFNGDGEFGDGNVDVVDMNGKLQFCDIGSVKDFGKFDLEATNLERILIRTFCSQFEFGNASFAPSYSNMSGADLRTSFIDSHLRPFNLFSVGTSTNWNASRFNTPHQSDSNDAAFVRQLFHRNTRNVIFDEIVKIRNYNFVGHVYDFSTLSGAILANNIYNSNCRCTLVYVPKVDERGRAIRIGRGWFA